MKKITMEEEARKKRLSKKRKSYNLEKNTNNFEEDNFIIEENKELFD